ncbi:hypothetical protein LOTGIDRAFT_168084 [Lottia gigantea]|uniref:Apple domain-containing protein n=1 Tax=Lottia gigantea TaxID=225164 RepID=V3Z371_LOTGI|nr:hypothetical protein LOTGIDRAFT_168084 [Lottia gigantea]ESO85063.1 hypothetical protein LOTGIDRAFT_168084 [Lottia gigantea]
MPESGLCFEFEDGYPGLPYKSIRLDGNEESYVDISLDGTIIFQDIAISFYLYPEGSKDGTLVHYLYDTGNIIRLSIMESILFVSFWDEYGVSVGATALPQVLVINQWNQLVVSREFATGTIAVYHNGKLMEELDDDFPNNIQLPVSGQLRIGRSHDKTTDGFRGKLTCFQLFDTLPTASDISNIGEYCQPNTWTIQPNSIGHKMTWLLTNHHNTFSVMYEEKIVKGSVKQCLTNETKIKLPSCEELIEMRCLTNGYHWDLIMMYFNWTQSDQDAAYFSKVSDGYIPPNSQGHLLGNVVTANRKVCTRLCMRVDGCQSYAYNKVDKYKTKCLLYDSVLNATREDTGSKYFSV